MVIQPDGDWVHVGDFNVPLTAYSPAGPEPHATVTSPLNISDIFTSADLLFSFGSRATVCDSTGELYISYSGEFGGSGIFRVDEPLTTATLLLTIGKDRPFEGLQDLIIGPSTGGGGNSVFFTVHEGALFTAGNEQVWELTVPECGVSGAVLLIIDEDSIDNGNPPNFFRERQVNDDRARLGQRRQLRFFENHVGDKITLHTGEVGDEGWFALKTVPNSWANGGPSDDGLRNFVGVTMPNGKIKVGKGLGRGKDLESKLDKIPDVTPLRASGLKALEGQQVCAVVYDSDISMNYDPLDGSLKGANLGRVAFEVISVTALTGWSSSTLPEAEIEILDAEEVCEGPLELFTDAPEPDSSSEPFDVEP